MGKDAVNRAVKKYQKKNTKAFSVRFNKNTEPEIVDKLESQENVTNYVRNLIREDLKKDKKDKKDE